MNATLLRAQGPAARAAHSLNETMNEIAADVRGLRAKADAPPPTPKFEVEENQSHATEREEEIPVAETSPPILLETAAAQSKVEARSQTLPAVVRTPAPVRERVDLPPVPDLRPELAALTAAITQQHAATEQALRQATALCQRLTQAMERHSTELDRLDRKIQHLTQRP